MKVASLLNGYKLKDAQARKEIADLKQYVDDKIFDVFSQMLPREKMYWLEGTATITSNNSGQAEFSISAPEGVILDDCIILGAMTKGVNLTEWRTVFDIVPIYDGDNIITNGKLPLNPNVVFTTEGTIKLMFSLQKNRTVEVSYRILLFDRTVG
jgi:hypothetical protein